LGSSLDIAVKDAAAHLGIEQLLDEKVTRLSVGQQQRVAAARAILGSPELIIADEPTSSLDANRRHAFLELLFSNVAEAGSTLLFVSHDLGLADQFDRSLSLPELNHAGE
jgi:putative ABC transport system ATP-binding protein